jgi:hypothetical protein
VRSFTHSPDAVIHSPAAIVAAWPLCLRDGLGVVPSAAATDAMAAATESGPPGGSGAGYLRQGPVAQKRPVAAFLPPAADLGYCQHFR